MLLIKKSHLHTEKVEASVFVTFNDPFPLFLKRKKNIGDAGDRTRGLSHAKRTRYHCATSPDILNLREKVTHKMLN